MTRVRAAAMGMVLSLAVSQAGCAHTASTLHTPLTPERQSQARALLQSVAPPPPLWAAQGLLLAYGHNERIRTRVQLLVGTPDKFRFTALGPHNAALAVVASDGRLLSSVDVRSGQSQRVPANREGLMQLANGFDVGVPLPVWLSLLTFRFAVPDDATAFERAHGQVAWVWPGANGTQPLTVLADNKGRIVGAHIAQADGGAVDASFLPPGDATAPQIAREVDVRVTRADGQLESSLSLSLEHADMAPSLAADVSPFVVGVAP